MGLKNRRIKRADESYEPNNGSSTLTNGGPKPQLNTLVQPHDFIPLSWKSKQGVFEKAAALYEQGLSPGEISKILGVAKNTVRGSLQAGGVAIRGSRSVQNSTGKETLLSRRGHAPYGHAYHCGKLVVDAKESKVVHQIIHLWREGKNLSAIVRALNGRKILTRHGKSWKHETIKQIIKRHEKSNQCVEGDESWKSTDSFK